MHSPPQMVKFFSSNRHILEGVSRFLEKEREERDITPPISQIFSSLHLISMDRESLLPNSLRVVIILQDPYTRGEAHGVAMSTIDGSVPMTLKNVNRCLRSYKPGIPRFTDGDIRGWCSQGVLLWNAALTTRIGESKAHTNEWTVFNSVFIKYLSSNFKFLVFVLLGSDARSMIGLIDQSVHVVLTAPHPVARGNNTFAESDIFTKVNEALIAAHRLPIQWESWSYVDDV